MNDEQIDPAVSQAMQSMQAPQTPAALDQRILDYAREQAPVPAKNRSAGWMPAVAAVCLAGIAIGVLLPFDQTSELSNDSVIAEHDEYTASAAASSASPSSESPAAVPRSARKEMAQAEAVLLEAEQYYAQQSAAPKARQAAPVPSPAVTTPIATGGQPAATVAEGRAVDTGPANTNSVPHEFLLQLAELRKQLLVEPHTSAFATASRRFTSRDSLADRSSAAAGKSAAAGEKAEDQALSPEQRYQQLREECDCGLPEKLQDALLRFENGEYGLLEAGKH